jgi:hypothetical protein
MCNCKRLRDNPAAKLVQMGADAATRTKRPRCTRVRHSRRASAPIGLRPCSSNRRAAVPHASTRYAWRRTRGSTWRRSTRWALVAATTTGRRKCSVSAASGTSDVNHKCNHNCNRVGEGEPPAQALAQPLAQALAQPPVQSGCAPMAANGVG